MPARGPNVTLRAAHADDASTIRDWRNDADTVRSSAIARPVSEAEHARWFAATLADPRRRLWVAEENGVPVGQVRVDLNDGAGVFSIVVAPEHRGRGIGQAMLRGALAEVEREGTATKLVALVRKENLPSMRAFEQVGFSRKGPSGDGFVVLELTLA